VAEHYLLVTIDTEVDKDQHWVTSNPVRFTSVTHGIRHVLSPLFEKYQVKPTYLLSPEVIEESSCAKVLRDLEEKAELGTHLHSEFVAPEREFNRQNMAGKLAHTIQKQYPREVEAEKLINLTRLFRETFGYAPTAFRAGRYGLSSDTFDILVESGYKVDSSVTPGLFWDYEEGAVDFRSWSGDAQWVTKDKGRILELPVSIRPANRLSPIMRDASLKLKKGSRLFQRLAPYQWLRPSWHSGSELIRYVQTATEKVLVLMFHSIEIIPGASPYARTEHDVQRILHALDELFGWCAERDYKFCGMTEMVDYV
jgi:hypothetical protein